MLSELNPSFVMLRLLENTRMEPKEIFGIFGLKTELLLVVITHYIVQACDQPYKQDVVLK